MKRNDAAAPGHVCPGIRIHTIDIVQAPSMGISPIADMDMHQTIVTAALAPKRQRRDAEEGTMGSSLESHAMLLQIRGSKLLARGVM
jgi:hypothetical protein